MRSVQSIKIFKHLIVSTLLIPNMLVAGINLEWEYKFDPASVGSPGEYFPIANYLIGPSGHIAVLVTKQPNMSNPEPTPGDSRFVLLNPDGSESWVSDNLHSVLSSDPNMPLMETHLPIFTYVGKGAMSFVILDNMTIPPSSSTYMYHEAASPPLNSIVSSSFSEPHPTDPSWPGIITYAEKHPMYDPMSMTFMNGQHHVFTPTTFYMTTANEMATSSFSHSIRKYSLDIASQTPVTAQTTTGSDGSNFMITWMSALNTEYQVQQSADMQSWTNVGAPVMGNGSTMNWSTPIISSAAYYRVVQN